MTRNSKPGIHFAIIPDGNRRWAKQRTLLPWQGHQRALENTRALIQWCHDDPRISILTLWGFSTENWDRSLDEVKHLMDLFEKFLLKEQEEFHIQHTRFIHAGRRDRIPRTLAKLIADIEAETSQYSDFTFQIALDYGGRDEVIRAVRRLSDTADVTEQSFREQFDHPELPDIDYVIRTSGEQRTSGFFIWQASYAEWKFVDKYFPDITSEDLEQSIDEYENRQRRFGK